LAPIPSFDTSENEQQGCNDTEMLETGRRYAVLLQKLQAVAGQ